MDENLTIKVTVEKESDVKTKVIPDSAVKVKASEMKYVKQNLLDADATPEDVLLGVTFYSKNSEDRQEGKMNPGDYAPIQSISKNGEIIEPDENRNVDIEVTKEDLGLGNVDNTKDIDKPVSNAQKEALDKKVDKELKTNSEDSYKVLSDNNYTDEEKETLSELVKMKENDGFGKVDDIKINGESIVKDKIANIELVDGFEDESVNKFSSAKNTSVLNKKINEVEVKVNEFKNYDDTELKKSISNLEDTKVSKEEGKGLSENDFTTFLKTKLEGIEEFAQANKLESISVNDAKVSVTNKNINIVAGENVTITNQDNNITINAKGGSGSANYPELKDLPTLDTTNTSALDVGSETINGTMKLHKVSKTGSFNDLLNVPTTIAHTDRNNNFGASQTFNGDITVNGNIIQQGENYITQAEEVKTKNDYITLREGAVGGLIGYAGFEVIKYDGTNNGRLVIDGNGVARVGDVGDEQPLATREETPTPDGFAKWDTATNRFITTKDVLSRTEFDNEAVKLSGDQEIDGIKTLKNYLKVLNDTEYTEYRNNVLSYYKDGTKKFDIDFNLGTFTKGTYSATLPDKTGTIALLSDIPTDYAKTSDLDNYILKTGGTLSGSLKLDNNAVISDENGNTIFRHYADGRNYFGQELSDSIIRGKTINFEMLPTYNNTNFALSSEIPTDYVRPSELNNYLPLTAGTSNGLKNLLKINNHFGIVAGYNGVSLCYSPEGENVIGHIVYFEHRTDDWDRVTPNGNNTHLLGDSDNNWREIYGQTIYQNGKQVANKEDLNAYAPTSHTQSITTITNSAGNTFTSAKVASAKTHTGWTNNATDDRIIPTMSFLAYWNGAHNTSNSSNLQYCANGTIVGTTGTQTISGAKTFSGNVTISGTLYIS